VSKYLSFELVEDVSEKRKTQIWDVVSVSSGALLGQIKWWGAWRQYTFHPESYTVFNTDCLFAIVGELQSLNDEHKKRLAAKKKNLLSDETVASLAAKGVRVTHHEQGSYGDIAP
jgi:hypothetical protein